MDIEVKLDDKYEKLKIIICTNEITDEVNDILQKLNTIETKLLTGIKDNIIEILDDKNIIRIYTNDKKVFALTNKGEYVMKLRLYELEQRLDKKIFVRISNTEIVNISKIKKFDLSFTGTICIYFIDGSYTYVSRRYVVKIKKILGL